MGVVVFAVVDLLALREYRRCDNSVEIASIAQIDLNATRRMMPPLNGLRDEKTRIADTLMKRS
ncbi:hypothetical protein [Paraburkholderia bannensis]|uniref:hypothetical protein n=1 Tax=Paraburkholderia bannensis TaxID=765414 RepID=UPI002AB1D907|nr:hypothetical protein [Paraburkholderia bannensis]